MRAVLQRVSYASVTVDNKVIGSCNEGFMILVGFTHGDTKEIVNKMIDKIIKLRIFEDENEKMNLSLLDINGEILSISQFTLYADTNSGRRPSFTDAANKEIATELYDYFNLELKKYVKKVETGQFGAHMEVKLLNNGPVTICLDSDKF